MSLCEKEAFTELLRVLAMQSLPEEILRQVSCFFFEKKYGTMFSLCILPLQMLKILVLKAHAIHKLMRVVVETLQNYCLPSTDSLSVIKTSLNLHLVFIRYYNVIKPNSES